MLGEPPVVDSLFVLVTGATLALYLALRLHASRRLKGIEFTERLLWVDRHHYFSWGLFITAVVVSLGALLNLELKVWLALLPAGLLSVAYGLPFLPVASRFRLRHKNYLKIFLISGVWAYMAVILPVVHTGGKPLDFHVILLFFSRFAFVMGITIPFDIRDIEIDSVYRLETIPSALGVRKSIHLSWALLAISFLLLLPVYLGPASWFAQTVLLPLLPIYLFTAWLAALSAYTKNDYLYLGLLDGTMLIQGPALWLAHVLLV